MKWLLALVLLAIATSAYPAKTQAESTGTFNAVCSKLEPDQQSDSVYCNTTVQGDPITGRNGILADAIGILSWVIGVTSVVIIIYGSIKYALSGGDPAKIKVAREIITYALVGLVIAVISRGIIAFIGNAVT